MSESQERMMAVVEPADVEAFMAICAKWDVLATVVGEVTEDDRLIIDWHGETVVDVDPQDRGARRPGLRAPVRPAGLAGRRSRPTASTDLARPATGAELAETLLRLVGSPNLCDKSWVTDQYDRYVRGNSVLAQPEDAGMLRIDEETGLGVALATDCNGRFACSTRTRAPSWRWPRRTATSRSPGPSRSRSPTASTSARRRTRR